MPSRETRARRLGCSVDELPDGRGKHGNHATGERNGHWNVDARLGARRGYVVVRVGLDHPHGWGEGIGFRYCFEHIAIAVEKLGRPLRENELVHHKNEDRADNRWPENLEVVTRSTHAKHHDDVRGHDDHGRFQPGCLADLDEAEVL